ncbi:MAG: hypothetical protein AB1546_16750 [bacterium]
MTFEIILSFMIILLPVWQIKFLRQKQKLFQTVFHDSVISCIHNIHKIIADVQCRRGLREFFVPVVFAKDAGGAAVGDAAVS